MIGLFCFDGPLYRDKDGVYCSVTLTDEMFQRYMNHVDELFIIVRTFSIDETYIELNLSPITLSNVKIVEVGNFNTIRGYLMERRNAKKELFEYVNQADMIFARMPSNISNLILDIANKIHKPYLVEVGGCAWDGFWNYSMLGKIIAPLMYFNARKNIKKAQFATYVTKQFLQKRYPNKRICTDCSNVYLPFIDENVLKERLKKIESMDMKHITIGQTINSIDVKYKGEHLMFPIMEKLKKQGVYVKFEIVGSGTGEFLIKEANKYNVRDQIEFLGTMRKEELLEWYKSIDIYVHPSKQEGLPRAVIEAMSTGCPAIGSNIAGIPELLCPECMFNPNNNNQILKTFMMIIDNEKLKEKAILNSKRSEKYNINLLEQRRNDMFAKYKEFIIQNKNKGKL